MYMYTDLYIFVQTYICKYKIINYNQIEFIARMQDWFIIGKSFDVIHHSNGIKGKIIYPSQ